LLHTFYNNKVNCPQLSIEVPPNTFQTETRNPNLDLWPSIPWVLWSWPKKVKAKGHSVQKGGNR